MGRDPHALPWFIPTGRARCLAQDRRMLKPYLVSTYPEHQLAEMHRLMSEEVEDVAVFFMDPDGVIRTWNRAAEVMKGYPADEIIGQHLALLYTEEDRA